MSKSTRSSKTPAPVFPSAIIAALAVGHDSPEDLALLLSQAEARLPKLVAGRAGLGPCAIQEAAHAMLDANPENTIWRTAARKARRTPSDLTNALNYETAMASFLLGLVAGTKMGGAR